MSYPEDENEHQPKPQEAEEAFLNNYEQDIIARVPFGDLEVLTDLPNFTRAMIWQDPLSIAVNLPPQTRTQYPPSFG
ncbi:hypothetical protein FII60_03845 [Salmonella enterica subsp. enterica]|nr:hypothetical protein [Salmonella enterica subsp. enterica serovar Paratyphi B]